MKKLNVKNNFTKSNQNGITLIALIVTIIVLIIIAGISIATLTADNGVLRQTNLTKVTQIESTAREQVGLACAAMRVAIAEAHAKDNSYSAVDNASLIQTKLKELIVADTVGLDKDSWDTSDLNTDAGTFNITYDGDDYKQVCNDTNASITFEITLGQKSIEITDETNSTLKDQNGNSVEIDIGAGGSEEGGSEEGGSGSGSGSDTGDVPETTKYSVTKNLTNATINNTETEVEEGSNYSATITAEEGYEVTSVTVTVGGTDVTETVYTSSTGAINITNVTGAIVITVVATEQVTEYNAVGKVAIGDYVYFDVPYRNAFDVSKIYDAYTGWRVIDDGQAHGSNAATGEIKLISTSTPLRYNASSSDVVSGLNGLTTGFFKTSKSSSGYNVWITNAFFEQDLTTAFNKMSSIIAKYTGGEKYTDDKGGYTTTTAATANQLKVRAANLSDLNRARGASLTSTDQFTDNLFYDAMKDVWLASAQSQASYTFYKFTTNQGKCQSQTGGDKYVRPVVTLKSGIQVTTAEKITDSNGTYWIMK